MAQGVNLKKKLSSPINLVSDLFPVSQRAPGLPFFKSMSQKSKKHLSFPSVLSHAPDHAASSHLPEHVKDTPQCYLPRRPGSLLGCPVALPAHTRLPNSLSVCFLIFRVTVSPAICSRWMASLSGLPFRLTLLIANIRSPTWMAPVLDRKGTVRNSKMQFLSARQAIKLSLKAIA